MEPRQVQETGRRKMVAIGLQQLERQVRIAAGKVESGHGVNIRPRSYGIREALFQGECQGRQGEQVPTIVRQCPDKSFDLASPQPGKPGCGGLGAGQVPLTREPDQPLLGGDQPAVRPNRCEGAAHRLEQVEVWLAGSVRRQPR
jgi:hypothetical protein